VTNLFCHSNVTLEPTVSSLSIQAIELHFFETLAGVIDAIVAGGNTALMTDPSMSSISGYFRSNTQPALQSVIDPRSWEWERQILYLRRS
jgi:hypothetical protein